MMTGEKSAAFGKQLIHLAAAGRCAKSGFCSKQPLKFKLILFLLQRIVWENRFFEGFLFSVSFQSRAPPFLSLSRSSSSFLALLSVSLFLLFSNNASCPPVPGFPFFSRRKRKPSMFIARGRNRAGNETKVTRRDDIEAASHETRRDTRRSRLVTSRLFSRRDRLVSGLGRKGLSPPSLSRTKRIRAQFHQNKFPIPAHGNACLSAISKAGGEKPTRHVPNSPGKSVSRGE